MKFSRKIAVNLKCAEEIKEFSDPGRVAKVFSIIFGYKPGLGETSVSVSATDMKTHIGIGPICQFHTDIKSRYSRANGAEHGVVPPNIYL